MEGRSGVARDGVARRRQPMLRAHSTYKAWLMPGLRLAHWSAYQKKKKVVGARRSAFSTSNYLTIHTNCDILYIESWGRKPSYSLVNPRPFGYYEDDP